MFLSSSQQGSFTRSGGLRPENPASSGEHKRRLEGWVGSPRMGSRGLCDMSSPSSDRIIGNVLLDFVHSAI